jgi:hypothetical protein
MKNNLSKLIKLLMITCLSIPAINMAEEATPAVPDEKYQCDAEEFNLMPIATQEDATISYVSGGVCIDEVELMKSIANNFPLEIVLVEKSDDYDKENYIADVRVVITDTKKEKKFLDVYTDGPFLLVNLPDNRYLITAAHNGVSKEYKVNIDNKKHKRIVFLWPTQ